MLPNGKFNAFVRSDSFSDSTSARAEEILFGCRNNGTGVERREHAAP